MTRKQPVEEVKPKKDTAPAPKERKLYLKWYFLTGAGTVLLVLAVATIYSFAYMHRIPPHTMIAGVSVGGLTKDQAQTKLAAAQTSFLQNGLVLHYQDKQWTVKPADLGTTLDLNGELDTVWKQDKEMRWQHQAKQLFLSLFTPRTFDANLTAVSTTGQEYFSKSVLSGIEVAYQEATLTFVPGKVTVVPGKAGRRLDANDFEASLYADFKKGGKDVTLSLGAFQPEINPDQVTLAQQQATSLLASSWHLPASATSSITLQPTDLAKLLTTVVARDGNGQATGLQISTKDDAVHALLTTWATQLNKKPMNAKLKVDNGLVVVDTEGTNGVGLNIDQSAAAVKSLVQKGVYPDSRELPIVFSAVQPEVRGDTLASLHLVDMIGTATTDFSGSPNNRVFNITKGESSLSGAYVPDGATFSTIDTLGPIEESTGYLPELVILGNRTVPEAGGGLCQVSTTLFRSVLNAGLPIVERTNHAYRVSYYERGVGPGLDATIYDPQPDFKWKNDTGHAVLVQAHITGTKLTFDLYGTKDGRVSTITTPQILETYPVGPPLYSDTDTLDKGTTKQVETAHDGAKTTVTYTVNRDGKQINQQTFVSVYKAWPAQFLVGTREPANPTPTPTPSPTP